MFEKSFLKNGYYIFNLNKSELQKLRNLLISEIKSFSKLKVNVIDPWHILLLLISDKDSLESKTSPICLTLD